MEASPVKRSPHRRKPKLIHRISSVEFFPDDGAFHEVVDIETLSADGMRINTQTKSPNPVGTLMGPTLYVFIDGRRCNAARSAWYFHHGETLPLRTRIKHIDGNVWNNRKDNLMIAKPMQHHAITRIAGAVVSLGRFETRQGADDAVAAARVAVGMGPVKTRRAT